MAENSAIEWTHHTWSPWEGCQKTGSPACEHCYAEARNARFGGGEAPNWGPHAPRRRTSAAYWRQPYRWNTEAPGRVFPSLCDPFDNAVDPQWRKDFGWLVRETPNLTWLLLTKRIGNAARMMEEMFAGPPPSNVWLGATVVTQEEADRDVPKLLATPAAKRFLSMEPLMGSVTLDWFPVFGPERERLLHWVIVGGESGPGARPMHPDWARSLRDQCAAAGVPFLFKQWGEWEASLDRDRDDPDWRADYSADYVDRGRSKWLNLAGGCGFHGERFHVMRRVGKKEAGRLLDGVQHDGVPA